MENIILFMVISMTKIDDYWHKFNPAEWIIADELLDGFIVNTSRIYRNPIAGIKAWVEEGFDNDGYMARIKDYNQNHIYNSRNFPTKKEATDFLLSTLNKIKIKPVAIHNKDVVYFVKKFDTGNIDKPLYAIIVYYDNRRRGKQVSMYDSKKQAMKFLKMYTDTFDLTEV